MVGCSVPDSSPQNASTARFFRFGPFELDTEAEQLSKNGRMVRLQPKPFKLLCLLAGQAGKLVTREEIQAALWNQDTFVDFEQGVNFAIKQVRDALSEDADRPMFIQTVPKRGYRFVAPVDPPKPPTKAPLYRPLTDATLYKALWTNIAELKLAENRRQIRRKTLLKVAAIAAIALAVVTIILVLRFAR